MLTFVRECARARVGGCQGRSPVLRCQSPAIGAEEPQEKAITLNAHIQSTTNTAMASKM